MALSLTADASRRDFLRITGLGAVGLALAACGGGGGTTAPASSAAAAPTAGRFGDISVQLSWVKNIEFGGEYFADSKCYYSEAGFNKVDLVTGPVDSADALVLAGNITVGISAPDATARFITEQGGLLKIIGNTSPR
jgi:ABC-type nitrate/sulfonate/bicarbonate transport system substrate-binding protein